jgi:uncharacterized membrane protein
MTNPIEEIVSQEQTLWKRALVAYFSAMILLGVRYVFGTALREHGLNSQPIGIVMLSVTVLLLLGMVYCLVKVGRLAARAKVDPKLKEALIDDELARLHIAESWKSGFIAAAVTPFAFLLIFSLSQMDDPVLVAFATPAVGSGAFLTSLYLKKRS